VDVENLDLNDVAGLGALYPYGTRQRVEAFPVEGAKDLRGGVRGDLAVAHLAGAVDDRVAGGDGEDGVQLVVPDVVDLVFRKVVRLRHSGEPPSFSLPFPNGTFSAASCLFKAPC
jgi:hypothetical protein